MLVQKRQSIVDLGYEELMSLIQNGDLTIRRLSPLECERLQGFPDGWTESCSDNQRYKMLGNAVTVAITKLIFSRLYNE